jgi:probable F420-dependent oxidoreductase
MAVHIGIGLFTGQVPPGSDRTFVQEYREILDMVRLAESLRFDSAWVSEHHGSSDGYMPSLLPTLAAMAAATDRIKLGTGVVLAPLHDPLRLAEDAATVDLISAGRLILGLGLGWRHEEFRMFGVPFSERVRRTVETVEILRRAWTGQRFSFEGKVYSYERVKITPRPAREQGISIYLGGSVEPAIRRAGRLGDGYIRTRGGGLEHAKRDLLYAEEGARAAGKDPSALAYAQLQNVFVWDDGDAFEKVKPYLIHQLGVYGGWGAGSDTPENDSLTYLPPEEELMRHLTPTGTPKELIRKLRPAVEAFAGRPEFHLIVRLHYPGMDFETASHAMELFAEHVIPALKGS